MFCQNCGNEMDGMVCSNCGWTPKPVQQNYSSGRKVKKKDSVLSIVSCVLTFVSGFVIPLLSVGGIVCGLIDLCINDKSKRHLGSWFGVIFGACIMIFYLWYLQDLMKNPMKIFR